MWGVAALLLFAAVATLRAVLDGEREIQQSDVAFDANDLYASIQHARRAASAYAPGAPHVRRGYERLLAIARGAEASGHPKLAVLAWQAQRAAILESASVLQPFSERLEEADRNLARLSALEGSTGTPAAERATKLLQQARAQRPQAAPWGALLPLGLLGCAAGLAWFARSGLVKGRIAWARGRWGLLLCAVGVGLWALGAFHG